MYKIKELRSRIGKIEEYMELGRKLEQIVDEPKAQEGIKFSLDNLIKIRESYNQRITNSERIALLREDITQIETRLGGEKRSREITQKFDECNHVKEIYTDFGKAMICGLFAGIFYPFSKKITKECKDACKIYAKSGRNHFRFIKMKKEGILSNRKLIKSMHEHETAEAQFEEQLKHSWNITDEAALEIIEKPEILSYARIELIKDKYAPWL